MDFFGGLRPNNNLSLEEQEMAIARRIAKDEQLKENIATVARKTKQFSRRQTQKLGQASVGVVGQTAQFAGEGMRQQVDFTSEQRMLGQMFGHGGKVWGINNQPVQINNDLNSSKSDPWDETSSMFGFGGFGQRSGLF